jgi:hypothetical protein
MVIGALATGIVIGILIAYMIGAWGPETVVVKPEYKPPTYECFGCKCLMRLPSKTVGVNHNWNGIWDHHYCAKCAPKYDNVRYDTNGTAYYYRTIVTTVNEKGEPLQ